MIIAEYIWLDVNSVVRSKTKVIHSDCDVNVNSKDGGVNYSNKTAVKGFVTGKVSVGSTGNNLLGDNDFPSFTSI